MKLGCSSWSYHRAIVEKRLDQRGWLELCAGELSMDGIELLDIHFPTLDKDYLREIKKQATDAGLTISCVSVSNDFGLEERDARDRELAKVKQWLNITAFFGAPVLRVFGGWYHGDVKKGGEGAEVVWREMVDYLSICSEYAAEQGIVLGIENHNGRGIVGTADEVERCLSEVKWPWLRLNLDTGDYGDIESIRRTLPQAVHVHAKLYDLDEKGADKQDWPAIASILREGNYRGFLSIEYEGAEDPIHAVPRGAAYLRKLLS